MSTLAELTFDDEKPSYDEAMKPFPNKDPHFLGTTLGLTVDSVTHIRQLGQLDEATLQTMRAACIQNVTPKLQYYEGWSAGARDKELHPNGDDLRLCVAKWKTQGINQDKSFLNSIIPNPESLIGLDTTYLLCDFVGFHDDLSLAKEKNRGSIVVLLSAPYGCKFVTNEKHVTKAETGGIYLMDDLYGHAVFPTEKMPLVDVYKLHLPKSEEYRDYFANEMAMAFALITHYYYDQY